MATTTATSVEQILGDEAEACSTTSARPSRSSAYAARADYVDDILRASDRPPPVLRSLQTLFDHGRLGGTGYVSILPVDQGIEHSAGGVVRAEPRLLRPENIVKLAIEGGLQRRRLDVRRARDRRPRKYAHKIPFIVKFNHNEFLSYPNTLRPDHVRRRSSRPSTWARRPSARRSTSARPNRRGRSRRSPRRSPRRTSSACAPCSGATCATRRSRPTDGATTTWRPTSPARPTTSA